jgi:hypothetical protein
VYVEIKYIITHCTRLSIIPQIRAITNATVLKLTADDIRKVTKILTYLNQFNKNYPTEYLLFAKYHNSGLSIDEIINNITVAVMRNIKNSMQESKELYLDVYGDMYIAGGKSVDIDGDEYMTKCTSPADIKRYFPM